MRDQNRRHAWHGWRTSCFVGLLAATAWTACFRFPIVWDWIGVGEGDKPFLDLYGMLAAGERAQAGFDSLQPNPLDPYHRPNIYPKWWLVTGRLGLIRSDTAWLGVVMALGMLLTAIGLLKPGNRKEAVATLGVLFSPALLMTVSRANNDLVIFVLVSSALGIFRVRSAPAHAAAVVILALAALLKYYPLAGLIVLSHARNRREFFSGAALYALVILLAAPSLVEDLSSAGLFKPRPEWLYAFGAPMLWRNFHLENPFLWMIPAAFVVGWAGFRSRLDRATETAGIASTTEDREFLVGSVFVVGCFFLGASYVYKLVFVLWLLPWLWRGGRPEPFLGFTRITTWLLYSVLWFEGLIALMVNLIVSPLVPQAAPGILYCALTLQQLLTWMLIAVLLRWIFTDVFSRLRTLMPGQKTRPVSFA